MAHTAFSIIMYGIIINLIVYDVPTNCVVYVSKSFIRVL